MLVSAGDLALQMLLASLPVRRDACVSCVRGGGVVVCDYHCDFLPAILCERGSLCFVKSALFLGAGLPERARSAKRHRLAAKKILNLRYLSF